MKISSYTLVNVILAAVLLTAILLVGATTTQSQYSTTAVDGYDPWCDLDDDGDVDIFDVVKVVSAYGTEGDPITKASVKSDSGWVNITDKAGQYFNITHNLNSTDIMVDIQGKTTLDGGIHQRHLGLTGYTSGWWRTYGGSNLDFGYCMIQTDDGGYVLTGRTHSYGNGGGDVWLVKTDWTGNREWNRTFGRSDYDSGQCVVQTSDGGYAIAGYTPDHPQGAGGNDVWLIKTDRNGYEQWNKTYGGATGDIGWSLVQTSDGGYAIGGYTASFGEGGDDFYLIKTNSTGDMTWNMTYGGTDIDNAYSVIQTSDDGYALTGRTWSFGAGPSQNLWLVKTYANGTMQWNRTYGGGTLPSEGWEVIQTTDGGFAVAGGKHGGATVGDFWLVKTDVDGYEQWNKTYGGSGQDEARSIVQTLDGGYVLAGGSRSNPTDIIDAWLVKTDVNGTMQWNKTYGGSDEDMAWSLIETGDGGYAMGGYTASFGAGDRDFWLVKTKVESGLAWTDSTFNTITLYRGTTDIYWNYVRVRIWKIRENLNP